MASIGSIVTGLNQPEMQVALMGLLVLGLALAWLLYRSISSGPRSRDPWDAAVDTEVREDDCPALCHRCLTPHDTSRHFCPDCGAMVGTYTGLMPPLYLHSLGDVMRAGTSGTYRRSPFLVGGYAFAAGIYLLFLPFPVGLLVMVAYWIMMFGRVPAKREGGGSDA